MEALVCWAAALMWLPDHGHVTYVEVALGFEAMQAGRFQCRGITGLHGVTLPLRTRGQVLKPVLDWLQPHIGGGGG